MHYVVVSHGLPCHLYFISITLVISFIVAKINLNLNIISFPGVKRGRREYSHGSVICKMQYFSTFNLEAAAASSLWRQPKTNFSCRRTCIKWSPSENKKVAA